MVIIMVAAGAPPVGGFIARKAPAVAQGASTKARIGQGRAQQKHKHQAESEKNFACRTHSKNTVLFSFF